MKKVRVRLSPFGFDPGNTLNWQAVILPDEIARDELRALASQHGIFG